MYFGCKYVETEPIRSHELTTFLKYHIPLRSQFKWNIFEIRTSFF